MKLKNKTIVVWFSCGAASAVAAKLTIDKYGKYNNVLVVNTPVKEEHEDNIRFKKDVENWIGHPIIQKTCKKYPNSSAVEVWDKRRYMSGINGAPCTLELKKQARYELEKECNIDYHVLGFTYDEKHRHDKFILSERDNVLPILIDAKMTKSDCFSYLKAHKILLPFIYTLGFPNANCIGCCKSSGVGYWQLVREKFPDIFIKRCEQSRELGCKLVIHKGQRIYLDELPLTAKGRKIKSWDCGIWCDKY